MKLSKTQLLIGCCFRHPTQVLLFLLFCTLSALTVVVLFKSVFPRTQAAPDFNRPGQDANRVVDMTATGPVSSQTRLIITQGLHGSEKVPGSLSVEPLGDVNGTSETLSDMPEGKSTTVNSLQLLTTKSSSAPTVVTQSNSVHKGHGSDGHPKDSVHSTTRTTTESFPLTTNSTQRNVRTSKPKSDRERSEAKADEFSQSGRVFHSVAPTSPGHNLCGNYQFHTDDAELQLFRPAVRGSDLCLLRDTLQTLTQALTSANITFFLIGGTLIGSWRHHGLVPWDDDVDITVDFRQQRYLRQVLSQLYPHYLYKPRGLFSWKVFSPTAHDIPSATWKWPFVDIAFFNDNATHVTDHGLDNKFTFPREWVFPLQLRPFQGLSLPCPAHTRRVLDSMHDMRQCFTGTYSHSRERAKDAGRVATLPCDRLRAVYPFVQHVPLAGQRCQESLLLNGTVLRQLVLDRSPDGNC